jgi:hypothetical protein
MMERIEKDSLSMMTIDSHVYLLQRCEQERLPPVSKLQESHVH